MKKKIISLTILFVSILLINSCSGNDFDYKAPQDTVVTTPLEDVDNNDESNDHPRLDNLIFDNGVIIDEIKEYENNHIALGSKNNYPYMQMIKTVDDRFYIDDKTFDFNQVEGKITDVIMNQYYLETTILISDNNTIKQNFFVSNNQIIPFHKKQLNINYSTGVIIVPKYFVIHETANTNVGADAFAHYRYWSTNPDARASTHFVVDSTQIYQMLELNQMAWHVGDNDGYSDIVNSNSIGIEIAVNSDGNYEATRQHAIELTIQVMNELNMNISQLKMHNDASGKRDPITMLNDPSLWNDFVNQVKAGLEN